MSNPGQGPSGATRTLFALQALCLTLIAPLPVAAEGAAARDGAVAAEATGETGSLSEVSAWLERAEDLSAAGAGSAAFQMLVDRAGLWLRSERTAESIALLEAATALEPESQEGWALLGRAHTRNRDFAAAEEALAKAVELGDASAATLVFLGAVQWENGDLAAAETTYRHAVDAGGAGGLARAQLGRLMLWQGRYAEAAEALELALGAGPSSADILFDRAEALRGAERYDQAIEAYRQVNRAAPTLVKAYYGLAVSLSRAGRAEESAAEFARYERLYREDQERTRAEERNKGEMERARALLEAGQVDAALAHLRGLVTSADVLALIARGQSMAGRRDEAVAALEQAVSLDPGRADLRRLLTEMRMAPAGGGG